MRDCTIPTFNQNRMSSNRVSALDGWRGISILLVLAGHLLPLGPKAWNLNYAVAGTGMAIFFTLSGCLITSVLLRDSNIRNFLIRRLMRIVPLAWLAATVTLLANGASADRYIPHLLFFANIGPIWLTDATGHFWSLCVEVQFYLMIALLVLAFGRRSLALLPLFAIAVTLFRASHHELMNINTQYRIDEILAGCTLALVLDRIKIVGSLKYVSLIPIVGLPVLVMSAHPSFAWLNYFRPYISATLVGASLFAARESLTARVLASRVLAYLAKISYAVYIIHGCLMTSWLGAGSTVVKYAKRPLLFLLVFGLAHVSTKYYESYFIGLGRRWTRPKNGRDGVATNASGTPASSATSPPIALIVAEHASTRFGGEGALAFHYFRVMRARGLDVRLLTHARVRAELSAAFPQDIDRIFFVEDTALQRLLSRSGRFLPARLASFTTGFGSRIATQLAQRQVVRRLIDEAGIQVVHQPMPVSPREPSLMYGFGIPVIIGPLNGNMTYPPGFKTQVGAWVTGMEKLGRHASGLMNTIFPGKRLAATVLVANARTGLALPDRLQGRVAMLPENGVDLSLWAPDAGTPDSSVPACGLTRFIYMGRLVDWKAVDLLVHAFVRAREHADISLTIIGDGPDREALQALARALSIDGATPDLVGKIHFAGWLTQQECAARLRASDALLLPSLWECGGAVVLEAMACELPVIATAWGGPLDYLDQDCGVLIVPQSREHIIQGFADAMRALSADPQRRIRMGLAARQRVERGFDWERKVDLMLTFYRTAIEQTAQPGRSVERLPI